MFFREYFEWLSRCTGILTPRPCIQKSLYASRTGRRKIDTPPIFLEKSLVCQGAIIVCFEPGFRWRDRCNIPLDPIQA